ncbi:MAG TPA: hypothetical protein VK076_01565 [Candidatus Sphingobacterium stercoripullorum]|uniref:DUF4328 domain-containing protein n=1 Tax=Candidatus Sphingobacterium stercoripullorum TaxID=2838759 RepID=A0A9D2AYY0_9SPHI|nr:hypothetical protein [Candidatus Sphingobacterium stercoripullorum]HLR49244.1 hypothetical protein [Candidatus Sphingobacterium stercoripullorum]
MNEIENIVAEMGQEYTIMLIVVGVCITIIRLIFANTIRKTLLLINPENRLLKPAQVWFLAVPLINIYWNFLVSKNLSYTLNNEFFDRKVAIEPNPTRKTGVIFAWSFLLLNIPLFPIFMMTLFFINVIFFIKYWVEISRYKTLIMEHNNFLQEHHEDKELH